MKRPRTSRQACLLAVPLAVLSSCGAELPTGAPGGEGAGAGVMTGELASYVADYEGSSEILHMLRDAAGTEHPLAFDSPPDLDPGDRIKVWGVPAGDKLRVQRFTKEASASALERRQQPLINGEGKPLRRWAFVLVNMGGGGVQNSAGQPLTKEAMAKALFDTATPGSIRNYFREVSYGTQDLDGEVFGPFNYMPANACDYQGVARALQPMIPDNFSQVLWYFGTRQTGCGWAGLASLGTADRPARNSWYNRSNGCVVLVQEPGHNFGMVHSSSMSCRQGAAGGMGELVSMVLPEQGSCVHNEYGNTFDPMGSGCFHMNGPQKAYQNWLSKCNVVKVAESGTFTLFPIEQACNGVQLLQVPLPAPRAMRLTNSMGTPSVSTTFAHYFIEYRVPMGFDARAPLNSPQVFVTVGPDLREAGRSGSRNWLVDMAPGTPTRSDAGLPVGRVYADPAPGGPKITVVSADRTKAVIKIEMGSGGNADAPGKGTCDDMTPFTAPGPEMCSAAPVNVPTTTPPRADGGMTPAPSADGGAAPDAAASAADAAAPGTGGASGIDNPGAPSTPAGAGGSSGGGGSPNPRPDAASGGPAPPASPSQPTSGGCSCRTGAGAPDDATGLPLLALGAVALLVRRRRRSR